MDPDRDASPHVAVLGAGVIGLQTALTLLEQKYRVTIVALSWPGDLTDSSYTSMFSGAQWRSNPPLTDKQQQQWDHTTLIHWRRLMKTFPPQEIGLEMRPAKFYWDSTPPHPVAEEHWWSIEGLLPIHEVSRPGFAAGFAYETIAINPRLHCAWLLGQCELLGVNKHKLHVRDIGQVFNTVPDVKAVVNCTGVAAGHLAQDDACFPTMGHLVLVRGRAENIVTRRNISGNEPWEALVIPRPHNNVTVLGGCKRAGVWSTEVENDITETILERCKPLAPELLDQHGHFDVLGVTVGLRPSRRGGPRMEVDEWENGKFIVHNYGHHSAGFEGCVGASLAAAALIAQRLTRSGI